MGFNLNPLNNTPQLKATQTQNGSSTGGLGYINKRNDNKQQQKENNKQQKNSLNKTEATYTLEDAKKASYADLPPLLKLIEGFKNILTKLLH